MAKTNPPHPRSYLAFSCAALDRIRWVHRICPPAYPAAALRQVLPSDTPGDIAFLDYLTRRADRYVAALGVCERARMLEDGWTENDVDTPQAQKSVTRVVALQCLRELREYELARLKSPKDSDVPLHDDDGRFPRRLVVDAIAGTHFAIGAGFRSVTATAINRGIPSKDRGGSSRPSGFMPTPTEIRSAVDAFTGRNLLSLAPALKEGDLLVARLAAWDARIVNGLWKRAQADAHLRSLACADAVAVLVDDGRFWAWLAEEEHRHDVPEISNVRRSELVRHARMMVKRYIAGAQRRPAGVVKTGRKSPVVSHASPI